VRLRSSHWLVAGFLVSAFAYAGIVAYQAGAYPDSHVPYWAGLGLSGSLVVALFLYCLVVALPEGLRRRRIKNSCLRNYLYRKRLLLRAIVSGSICGGRIDLSVSPAEVERLMSVVEFRKTFGQGRDADEGFCAYSNYIHKDETEFRSATFQLSLIARQLDHLFNNYDIENVELFEVVKNMEEVLFSARVLHADYDDVKRVAGLLYSVFSGLSLTSGYRDYDPIEKGIRSL
jgi:hypothetical protein